MIHKIVYLSYLPLTAKIKNDFYVERLADEGFEVEYIDIWSLFFDNKPMVGEIHDPIIRTIESYQELERYIKEQDKETTLFISLITYESRCLKMHRLLTRYGCHTARYGNNMMPLPYDDSPYKKTIWQKLKGKSLSIIFKLGLRTLRNKRAIWAKKTGRIKPFELLFCSARLGYRAIGAGANIDIEKGEVIHINSTDYGTYQQIKSQTDRVVDGDYILFLDEYLPMHPDFILFDDISTIEPTEYYKQINRFFIEVEQRYGLPVVVAAHPKALRYKDEDFFDGRKVFFGQTAALVKDAKGLIAHGSTSCGFAVMFDKPIVFLSSDQIKQKMAALHTAYGFFAKTLGAPFLNYDESLPPFDIFIEIDHEKYQKYKYNYLVWPDTEDKRSEDIVVEAIKAFNPK